MSTRAINKSMKEQRSEINSRLEESFVKDNPGVFARIGYLSELWAACRRLSCMSWMWLRLFPKQDPELSTPRKPSRFVNFVAIERGIFDVRGEKNGESKRVST